ncbi:MAG TPA: ATP-dependent zinc metalloprotease FtsH [Candidatus Peribacteria bacterium]|nr:ATP-dependent zinc metalloprotease FtsH [Candidatus Peribacteria bacterium]
MPVGSLPPRRRQNQVFTVVLIAFLILSSLYYITAPQRSEDEKYSTAKEVSLSDVTHAYAARDLESILIRGNNVYAKMASGSYIQAYKESADTISRLNWNDPANPTKVEIENIELKNFFKAHIGDLIFFLLIIGGAMWVFRSIARSQSTALSFGKSRARVADMKESKTTFKDVAGCDEAKEDLQEIVDFLKNPRKYTTIGAKIPRGALLVGAPGTGKTLLARAVAGEAGVPFFSISGSEFVEMFVGVGASRVRDLFMKAKRNSPCIIFIDEIDAVGRQRGGAGFGGGHDEREQTLNQILTEMDGFDKETNVIVMAATNRPDVLDSALLRPGRFDRRVFIDKPDLVAREQILEVHARNKKMGRDIDLKTIARQTVGMAGADLENVMNEAAIYAARQNKKFISQEDIVEAVEKVTIGSEKKSRKLTEKEKKITAYHELGHAVVGYLCPESDPLHKISIVSRGFALGVTWFLPKEDEYTTSKTKFLDQICGLLGGRAAEEIIFGEITTGASNDIEKASAIARNMAMRYGMDEELGIVSYGEKQGSMFLGADLGSARNYSEEVARKIDHFVKTNIAEQYKRAKGMVQDNRKKMDELCELLLKIETMSAEEFAEVFDGGKRKRVKKAKREGKEVKEADA